MYAQGLSGHHERGRGCLCASGRKPPGIISAEGWRAIVGAVRAKKRVGETQKRPPSPADEADAKALDMAVESMIQQVLSGWDYTRPLGSLNRGDLRRLATAAITGFVIGKSEWDANFRESGHLTDVPFTTPN